MLRTPTLPRVSTETETETETGVELDPLPHQADGCRFRFDLRRAIHRLIARPGQLVDGLEGEVSREIAHRTHRTLRGPGVFLPWDTPISARALDATGGAGAIAPRTDRAIIDILRPKFVCMRLGARMATDLVESGGLLLPRKTSAAALSYLNDGQAPAAQTDPTVNQQASITPHTVGAYCDVSRHFFVMMETATSIVVDDCMASIAAELDHAALVGSGATGQPTGVLNNGAVAQYPIGANGGPPTWQVLTALESALANSNFDSPETSKVGFLTSPNGRSVLRRTVQGVRQSSEQKVGLSLWPRRPTSPCGSPDSCDNDDGLAFGPLDFCRRTPRVGSGIPVITKLITGTAYEAFEQIINTSNWV
jgi:hypothetical protein